MERTRMEQQIDAQFVFQIDWNLLDVLLKAVAVEKLLADLKIWVMSSVGSAGSDFADKADLS